MLCSKVSTIRTPQALAGGEVRVKGIKIGNHNPFVLIGGSCVIESEEHALYMAEKISGISRELEIPYIFKSSFDKANRSSVDSFRGVGIEKGLKILQKVKKEFGVPVLADVHSIEQIPKAAKVLDIIQIPALLSRQTDLIVEVAKHNIVVNIKKGQFMAPQDIYEVIKKVESTGNKKILLTERGTTFGYNNLVSDMRSLEIMKETGYPVIYDASHSVQLPGDLGHCSSGDRKYIPSLSRAAIAVGIAGLFIEIHDNPARAKCDGENSLPLGELRQLLEKIKRIDRATKYG